MLKYIKLFRFWNNVKSELKKERWYVSRDFYYALTSFGAKCCSTLFEIEVLPEEVQTMTEDLYLISISTERTIIKILSVIKKIKEREQNEEDY